MKLKALGTGSAFVFSKNNFQSNFWIEADNGEDSFIFDIGTTINDSLEYHGYTKKQVKNIYISHNHADHNGGAECIALSRYFGTFPHGIDIPGIYGNTQVLNELWENSLKAGMKILTGVTAELGSYFTPNYIDDSKSFNIGGMKCLPVKALHVQNETNSLPTYGLFITAESGTKMFITGDTQFTPDTMMPYYVDADIILHDCEMANFPGGVHSQYHQLCTLPAEIKNKMWLYHYATPIEDLPYAHVDGFKGFLVRGQEITI